MADGNDPGTGTDPAPTNDPPKGGGSGDGPGPDTVEYWQARARQWEDRAKANADAAKRLPELETAAERLAKLEEAGKSDVEKASNRATAAEREAATAKAERDRLKVALAKGLPADLVDRLRGDTLEEMNEDADTLLALIGKTSSGGGDTNPSGRRPTPDLRPNGGANPEDEPEETDPAKLAATIPRGR